jgi:hypothetical protein
MIVKIIGLMLIAYVALLTLVYTVWWLRHGANYLREERTKPDYAFRMELVSMYVDEGGKLIVEEDWVRYRQFRPTPYEMFVEWLPRW